MTTCAGCIDGTGTVSMHRKGAWRSFCERCAITIQRWESDNDAEVGRPVRSPTKLPSRIQRELGWPKMITTEAPTTALCPGRKKPMPDLAALDTWAADRKRWPRA